jgi:hypothetical protein
MATSIGLEGNNSDSTFALKRLFVWNAYTTCGGKRRRAIN